MDARTNQRTNQRTNERTKGWANRRANRRMDQQTNGKKTDEQTSERNFKPILLNLLEPKDVEELVSQKVFSLDPEQSTYSPNSKKLDKTLRQTNIQYICIQRLLPS